MRDKHFFSSLLLYLQFLGEMNTSTYIASYQKAHHSFVLHVSADGCVGITFLLEYMNGRTHRNATHVAMASVSPAVCSLLFYTAHRHKHTAVRCIPATVSRDLFSGRAMRM